VSITRFRKSLSHILKPFLIVIAGVFVVGCFSMFGGNMFGGDDGSGKRVPSVAKVNGEAIPSAVYARLLDSWQQQMKDMTGQEPSASEVAGRKGQLLGSLIDQAVRKQAAKDEGIRVSRGEVKAEIEKNIDQQIDSARAQIAAMSKSKKKMTRQEQDRELEARLKHFSNDQSMTLDKYRRQLREGYDSEQVKVSLMTTKLDAMLRQKVRMTDKELEDSYRQVTARRILIATRTTPEAQAKRKAEEILKKLRSGENFAALASEFSDDPLTKSNGGVWPMPLSPGQAFGLDPVVSKAVFALKPNEVSDVIRTGEGFEIVKVDSEKLELPKDFSAKKKQYMTERLTMKQEQAVSDYYRKLTQKAKVEVMTPDLRGYWILNQAGMRAGAGQADFKKTATAAAREFEKAILENKNDAPSIIMLARLYQAIDSPDKALKVLELALETERSIEGADLRMMLGDMYAMKNDSNRAEQQYRIAGEVGYADYSIHQQLTGAYTRIGKKDLAAKEQQWVDEYNARRTAEMDNAGASAPAQGR
jgi:foldase protein PrsA